MDNTAAKHFYPLIVKENFEFEGGFCEGKVLIYPFFLAFSKEIINYLFNSLLKVIHCLFHTDFVLGAKHLDCFHLVENWIVEAIDFIPAINISFDRQ